MGLASDSTSNGSCPSTAAHVSGQESVIQKYLRQGVGVCHAWVAAPTQGGPRGGAEAEFIKHLSLHWLPQPCPGPPAAPEGLKTLGAHLKAGVPSAAGRNLRQDSLGNTPCVT